MTSSIKGMRVAVLLVSDLLLLCLAWYFSEILGTPWNSPWTIYNPISLLPVLGVELSILIARGCYGAGNARRNYLGLIKSLTLGALLILLIGYFYRPDTLVSRSQFVLFWILGITSILTMRSLINSCVNRLRRNGVICYPVALISDSEYLEQSIDVIQQQSHYNIVKIAEPEALDSEQRDITFEHLRQLGIAEVFVSWGAIKNRLYLCWQFRSAGIRLHVIPNELNSIFQGSKFWVLGNQPALSFTPPSMTYNDFWIKRVLDFCSALFLLVVLLPIYSIIALAIRLDSPGSIFYRQTRIGLHGKPFKAWKFRTMIADADKLQSRLENNNETKDGILFKMKDDPRITSVGRFLRQYSLDELPQLLNVLLGEMSIVGPRPLPIRDVEKFAQHHFVRHEVLPGITGLWQVSGRSNITDFEQVLELDLTYIQNWSLWLDLKILLRTFRVVSRKTGAY